MKPPVRSKGITFEFRQMPSMFEKNVWGCYRVFAGVTKLLQNLSDKNSYDKLSQAWAYFKMA